MSVCASVTCSPAGWNDDPFFTAVGRAVGHSFGCVLLSFLIIATDSWVESWSKLIQPIQRRRLRAWILCSRAFRKYYLTRVVFLPTS
jgi:hypothetical protein